MSSSSENQDSAQIEVEQVSENSQSEATENENFKWYIARTVTGQENKVSQAIKERITNLKLGEYFSRVLVPEETVVTNAGGKKGRLKRNFSLVTS